MVQTKEGALRNPWLRQVKRCAGMYKEEKEARANAPRRRLNQKSPEEDLYAKRKEAPKREEKKLLAIKDREPPPPRPPPRSPAPRPARAAAAAVAAAPKPAAASAAAAAPPRPAAAAAAPPRPAAAAAAPPPPRAVGAAAGPAVVSTLPIEARRPLLKFVNKARDFLQKQEGGKATAARLYKELAAAGDLKEVLKNAGLPVKTPIVSFVKAFPLFVLETGARGGANHVSLRRG